MKLELRKFTNGPVGDEEKHLLLIVETEAESKLIDEVFGNRVDDDDKIADVRGEVRLSDGYGAHYITLKPMASPNKGDWRETRTGADSCIAIPLHRPVKIPD